MEDYWQSPDTWTQRNKCTVFRFTKVCDNKTFFIGSKTVHSFLPAFNDSGLWSLDPAPTQTRVKETTTNHQHDCRRQCNVSQRNNEVVLSLPKVLPDLETTFGHVWNGRKICAEMGLVLCQENTSSENTNGKYYSLCRCLFIIAVDSLSLTPSICSIHCIYYYYDYY